jgi:hypothetical protein
LSGHLNEARFLSDKALGFHREKCFFAKNFKKYQQLVVLFGAAFLINISLF